MIFSIQESYIQLIKFQDYIQNSFAEFSLLWVLNEPLDKRFSVGVVYCLDGAIRNLFFLSRSWGTLISQCSLRIR